MRNKEYKPTIYENIIKEKVRIACAQVAVLNCYETSRDEREKRAEELYDVFHESVLKQSEKTIEDIEDLIYKFKNQIRIYREINPEKEKNSKKIRDKLEKLISSGAL